MANCKNGQCGPYARQPAGGGNTQWLNDIMNQKYTTHNVPGAITPQMLAGTTVGTSMAESGASGVGPYSETAPITPLTQPAPVTMESTEYLNAVLRTQIGRRVTVSFLIGTNTFVDRTGTLLGVGANYIIINPIGTNDVLFCDFYSIKFIQVFY